MHHGAVHLLCDGMLHCVLERQFLRLVRPDLQVPLDVVKFVESHRLRPVVLLRVFDNRFLQRYLWLRKKKFFWVFYFCKLNTIPNKTSTTVIQAIIDELPTY